MQGTTNLAQVTIASLKGVGPAMAEKFAKLGLNSVQDLLFHLPLRYEDRTRVTAVRDLLPGIYTNIIGEITNNQVVLGRKRMLVVTINDGTGSIDLRFFHFSVAQKNALAIGTELRCYGEVQRGPRSFQIVHPEYKPLDNDQALNSG